MKHSIVCTAIFVWILGLAALAAQTQNHPPPIPREAQTARITAQVPAPLKITFGDKSATWTPATLASLPHVSVTVHNEHTKADETYSGVPLMALLTPLGVSDKPHGKNLRFYVVAVGSDGYDTVYSIGEVNPDLHDATVIVADAENGKPLTSDGPLKLISTRDKLPSRWVRNLVAIRVFTAE